MGYVLQRLIRLVLTLIAVSIITFGLLRMVPGSFAELSQQNVGLGQASGAATGSGGPDQGRPAWLDYLTFMKEIVTWHLPASYKYPQLTVSQIIAQGFPVSLSLAVLAIIVAIAISVPIGLFAALHKDRPADYGLMFVVTALAALPGYLLALILILVFASWLRILPTGGWAGPQNMIIPVVALGIEPVASLARYTRTSVLEQLREEYVVAALAKGGRRRVVMVRHVLRNSLIPLVTVAGPMFAHLATGTVFIEALMGIPGLGLFFATAARTRDMPLLMASTLFFALILVLLNLLVDLSYRFLDPRIRYQSPRASARSRRQLRADLREATSHG